MIVKPGFRRRALVVALSTVYGMGSQLAQANPTGAQVVNGQAAVQAQGNKLTVTNTPGAIINWKSFSIGAGETTYFQQQNAASAVLNRVQVQNPALKSQIDGALGSNGRVFLINPNGIMFGAGSVINTQGLVASTLNLNDEDFKAGKFRFARQGVAGSIQALGQISSGNGDVYLVAPNIGVDGSAVISSSGGNVVLAAGEMVEITGRNLNDIKFIVQSKDSQAVNLGTLSGGAVGVFAGTLNHSGVIQAQTLALDGGRIVLKGQGNVVLGAGATVRADGDSAGGAISIVSQGGIVAIERDAQISANGAQGGSVDVRALKVSQDGAIRADGDETRGGTITLHGNSRVVQSASALVSAQGVSRGGDIRLSVDANPDGSGNLFTSATIDASASSGVGGGITVTGRDLTFAAARLVANGDSGGGSVFAGGGRSGANSGIANSQNVTANAATSFEASASVDGNGGTVVAWAEGVNRFAGIMEARGGANSGNGGFIEVSGKERTEFGGLANAGAPHGASGTFLLDPMFVRVSSSAGPAIGSIELLDPNPGNDNFFGNTIEVFANGNILVFVPQDDFSAANSGAVYLYNGVSGSLLSSLRGSAATDRAGSGGLAENSNESRITLGDGSVIVSSPFWNGSAGAFTTYNTIAGVSGSISSANSMVGGAPGDRIGSGGIELLNGGTLAFFSPEWTNGTATAAGAITWVNGTSGMSGFVTPGNSLVGSHTNDRVGGLGITYLYGGGPGFSAYAVGTSAFDNNAGAVTWVNGSAPPVGPVGAANSLVGSNPGDRTGSGGIVVLSNGNYVIRSPNFAGGAGAVTWASGTAAITGTIGASSNGNSIFGSNSTDAVGAGGIEFLDYYGSGNFVVSSPNWGGDSSGVQGAVTFGSGTSGFAMPGPISFGNSLVGSNPGDALGSDGITVVLGNYLVHSPNINGGAGALTWGSGTLAISGTIDGVTSNGNSITGSLPTDAVGTEGSVTFLNNGNFVVKSMNWGGTGVSALGAVTWGDYSAGFTNPGPISGANSLVGTNPGDRVGSGTLLETYNGNYVVASPSWGGGKGAVTFGIGTGPITGSPDAVGGGGNGILGVGLTDAIGSGGLRQLNFGNFVAFSPDFDNGTSANAGAFTWGDETLGFTSPGVVSAANSLVGTNPNDRVGNGGITELSSGNYLIHSASWGSGRGAATFATYTAPILGSPDAVASGGNGITGSQPFDAVGSPGSVTQLYYGNFLVRTANWGNTGLGAMGAVTWGDSVTGFASPGVISSANSLVGTTANDRVGAGGITELFNTGNYVVKSPFWGGGKGAATYASGFGPITGSPDNVTAGGNGIFGSSITDAIGNGGVTELNNGNFVVFSPNFANGVGSAGAVSWGDRNSGFGATQVVSNANSLIGTNLNDRVGSNGITQFGGGDYLIRSPNYGTSTSGGAKGAVTWASGSSAVHGNVDGLVTNGNSIFGTFAGDGIGSGNTSILNNSKFVVASPNAADSTGLILRVGAVTFGSQDSGFAIPGMVTTSNSLMGSFLDDQVGIGGVQNLSNDKFAVLIPSWNGNRGAITWGSDTLGIAGLVDGTPVTGNSLVGSTGGTSLTGDRVGSAQLVQFGSGYYARTAQWSGKAGAITWINTVAPPLGPVDSGNSLVGAFANDQVGSDGIYNLGAGKTLVFSQNWNGFRGAVTWVDNAGGTTGVVGAGNSLVGSTVGDEVGSGYWDNVGSKIAIFSPSWNNGSVDVAGAVTWADAGIAITGPVTAANSLVGGNIDDEVGLNGFFDFVSGSMSALRSTSWNDFAGAVTWIDHAAPPVGLVSSSNSLVGSNTNDRVGNGGFSYGNGYQVVRSASWNAGRGAVTWVDSAAPRTGVVSSANSLVGASPNDFVGNGGVTISPFYLANGDYIVNSPNFNAAEGAITIGSRFGGISGVVSGANSLVGFGGNFRPYGDRTHLLVTDGSASSDGFTSNGRICLYAGGAGCASGLTSQFYSTNPGGTVTITPQQIARILGTGTAVVLQANTDIVIDPFSDIVVDNPFGDGGDLALEAGRSVLIGSSIITDNGHLRIVANDNSATATNPGVLAAYREPGTAEITMADGTVLFAGSGDVDIQLREGVGHSGAQDPNSMINLRSIVANNLWVQNDFGGVKVGDSKATLPSSIALTGDADVIAKTSILFAGGANPGAFAQLAAYGQITIDPPSLTMSSGASFARIVNTSGLFPIKLTVSECINCIFVSPYEIIGPNTDLLNAITAAILSMNPIPWAGLDNREKSRGDIEVEGGESCQ